MTFELPPEDKWCHHTGFEKKCCDLITSRKCKRWRFLPGNDPFTEQPRQQWGCVDDLVLFLQGEAGRQAEAAHAAVTDFREMAFNSQYRQTRLSQQPKMQTIEDRSDADHDHR